MMSTPQQTIHRSEFGIPVARAACFWSPEAETEALQRGRRAFACELEAGIVPHFIDAATGACTYVDPTTGEPVRHAVVIRANHPDGFGTSHVVRHQPPPSHALALDKQGQRVAVQSTTRLLRARLIYEYVPSIDGWHLMTYHPEAESLPDEKPNLR